MENKGPKRLQDQWALLSEGQFEPFSLKISEVLPLDPDVLSVISNINYETPLGCLVDFYFHLDEKRRVHANCMYTDPKKVSTSKTNNNVIQNTVCCFYTYVCEETGLSINDETSKAKVLQSIENPKLVQGFLMSLAESGRKSLTVFTSLSALHNFQRFLVKCNIIPDIVAFKKLKDDVGLHFSPLVKYDKARLQKAKAATIEKVEQFPLEDYLFLLNGDEINMIGRRWASFDFGNASLADCEAMQECTEGVAYLDFLAFNVARASDNTTIEVSA